MADDAGHGIMATMVRIRAVIDTNVVFEGLTQYDGPAGTIVSAWIAELFQACISQALAYEYADVLAKSSLPNAGRGFDSFSTRC